MLRKSTTTSTTSTTQLGSNIMDNNAFKDLVRTHNQPGSSKAIARKAVEEEFQKKKKRTRGGGYNDSDDEDEGGGGKTSFGKKQRNKGGKPDNNDYYGNGKRDQKDDDNAKAIEEDLSSRYRDRAKERREGGTAVPGTTAPASSSDAFLIIPHNKRGLDIALARKDRQAAGLKLVERDGEKSMTATTTENKYSTVDDDEVPPNDCKIRKELPSLNEAKLILEDFISSKNSIDSINSNSSNNNKDNNNIDGYRSIIVSSGMVEYINGVLKLKTSDISSFSSSSWDNNYDNNNNGTASSSSDTAAEDENTCSMAGKTLQRTMYSLAIDGHPSDSTRAWEIPRQYTLSRVGSGSSSKSPILLSKDVMNKIDLVFKSRNIIRDEMMKEQVGRTRGIQSTTTTKGEASYVKDTTNKGNNSNNQNDSDDDDDDDDIFGGLDN